jgi:hypothetical protein
MGRARVWFSAGALALALTVLAGVAGAEVVQQGNLRVSFDGGIAPQALPRHGKAPVAVTLGGQIATTDRSAPPQLRTISIAINRSGRLDTKGLPACRYHQIQPASTREAMAACRRSIIGEGEFRANVVLPEQSPFPSRGRVVAFHGVRQGQQVVFAHIFGTEPLPQVAADWGYVSGVELTLKRQFRSGGRDRSYISAGCPAPGDFTAATFPLARASFGFEDGRVLTSTLIRTCRVKR